MASGCKSIMEWLPVQGWGVLAHAWLGVARAVIRYRQIDTSALGLGDRLLPHARLSWQAGSQSMQETLRKFGSPGIWLQLLLQIGLLCRALGLTSSKSVMMKFLCNKRPTAGPQGICWLWLLVQAHGALVACLAGVS